MPEYLEYLRKSRSDIEAEARGEGETLARHRTMLSALAARNNHHIPESNIYHEVVSGESISDRPQVQLLLDRLRSGSVAGVYVMELERLARGDTIDQGTIARAFKYSGAKIITPTKTYDPNNEFDEEYFEFGLFMSRREYKTINRRIQSGRLQSVKEGKFIGSRAPYGYRKVKIKHSKGYTLEIQEDEANIVRSIFDWYIRGRNGKDIGITAIAHLLHDMGIPAGENGAVWNQCRVYRMLTNEVYAGMIRWGYDKTVKELSDDGVKKRREVSESYQLHKGIHEAIVSKETYDTAQSILRDHGKIPVNKTSEMNNPLSRILYCSVCGRAMLGNGGFGRIKPYVKCRTRDCITVQTVRKPIEDLILDTLKIWVETIELGGEIVMPVSSVYDTSANENALISLRTEREGIQKQKVKLYDLVEQGVYTMEIFNERFATLNEKLAAIDKSIKMNEDEIKNKPEYKSIKELAPQIRTVLNAYDGAGSAKEKNELLLSVISRVEFSKTVRGMRGVPSDQFELKILPALAKERRSPHA